jgi:hypothetical protein
VAAYENNIMGSSIRGAEGCNSIILVTIGIYELSVTLVFLETQRMQIVQTDMWVGEHSICSLN